MGLFGFGKGKDKHEHKGTGRYQRPRAAVAPEGWIEAQALVDSCEAEQTKLKYGSGDNVGYVYRTTTSYLIREPEGALLPIVVEARLQFGDIPKQGARLMVAYDPRNPTDIVVLLSEAEHTARVSDDARQAVRDGSQAPCEIIAAEPTGRVSRPKAPKAARGRSTVYATPDPAPEFLLTLHVTPAGAEPFEVTRTFWDHDLGLAPGTRGTLFFLPGDPARGYPVFPSERHRVAGGDVVRLARDEFVAAFAAEGSSETQGKVQITRGPVRLEG